MKYNFKIGDMVQSYYGGFLAIVVDIPDQNVLELEWVNAPNYFENFQVVAMIKPVD